MNWKQKKIDSITECNIITGMIISDQYIKELQAFFKIELLQIQHVKTVAKWCLDYFTQYNAAPNYTIQEMFDTYVRKGLDESEAKTIGLFLETLAQKYDEEEFNVKYMLDQAEAYIRKRALEILKEDITTELVNDNLQEAEALIANYKRPIRTSTKGINAFTDRQAIRRAFNEKYEYLFKLPDAWGELVGTIIRGDFLAVWAPGKRGKSWCLLEMGLIAAKQKCKVLFVSLEMTEPQVMRRIYCNLTGETKKPKTIMIPVLDCLLNQINQCEKMERRGTNTVSIENNVPNDHIPCTVCKNNPQIKYENKWMYEFRPLIYHTKVEKKGITHSLAVKRGLRLQKRIQEGGFRLVCFPGKSLDMIEFNAYLDNLSYFEEYNPDVIITDYADFFKPMKGDKETRHQINATWEAHRAIAQTRNCAVITATHTNKQTFGRKIEQGDSSEDSRKINHVTKSFGLNQEPPEKKKGIIKVSMLAQREDDFNTQDEVVILQQLDIGKFHLDSYKKQWNEK